MPYSDFTLERVLRDLKLQIQSASLFPGAIPTDVPHSLAAILGKRTLVTMVSEKSRSEFIVVPILMACSDLSPVPLTIFSGYRFDVDPDRDLKGECDFILTLAPPVPPVRAPIASIVEAKKGDIELALGQCIAQMLAASLFNQQNGTDGPMFGIVTTGEVWQFLRLVDATVEIDERRYYLDDPPAILGALGAMIAEARVAHGQAA